MGAAAWRSRGGGRAHERAPVSDRRALEQGFVQQKIDEVIDEAGELGESAEVPNGLRAKVKERLQQDKTATWDSAVKEFALQHLDDEAQHD